MQMSPSGPCSSLSMPLGPSEVRRMRDTALAAWMLLFTASRPFTRDFFSCSCTRAAAVGRGSGGDNVRHSVGPRGLEIRPPGPATQLAVYPP